MVRPMRIQYEGALYHILSRGDGNDHIFPSDIEKSYFLELLAKGTEKYGVEVYAYCIMSNHYHLLFQTLKPNLSEFMHFLGSSYASFLAKKGWIGHIFAGRYKSICVEHERYLLTLIKYIYRNPVEAAVVEKPEDYLWSSYFFHIYGKGTPTWLRKDWLVEYFGPGIREARKRFMEFINEGIGEPFHYPNEEVVAQAILGGEEFIAEIRSLIEEKVKPLELTGHRDLVNTLTLKELYQRICEYYGLAHFKYEYHDRCSGRISAIMLFIFMAREYTTSTNGNISEFLGDITPNTISRRYTRLKRELIKDKQYKIEIDKTIQQIIIGRPR
jgi:putative transposase